jgi:hypothetical protein
MIATVYASCIILFAFENDKSTFGKTTNRGKFSPDYLNPESVRNDKKNLQIDA